MKIYSDKDKEESSVELLLNYQELRALVDALAKFEAEIKQYKTKNKTKNNLGFTHMHFMDYYQPIEKPNTDIIFYVDLDDESV